MSLWTLGEIAVWLGLAAALGFVLGWLARELRHRTTRTVAEPAAVGEAPPEPEPVVVPEPEDPPGAASPTADGGPPSEHHVIKAKTGSMIYHTPDSPSYGRTVAEVWFATEEDAVAAGFRPPRNARRR